MHAGDTAGGFLAEPSNSVATRRQTFQYALCIRFGSARPGRARTAPRKHENAHVKHGPFRERLRLRPPVPVPVPLYPTARD